MSEGLVPGPNGHSTISLAAVGDVRVDRDDPPSIFQHSRDILAAADIVFGQCEVGFSDRGQPFYTPTLPLMMPARNVTAVSKVGGCFDVMSYASNHAMDYGADAFTDTLELLQEHGVATVGAGANLAEARKPAIVERVGVRVGFLAYCAILQPGLAAEEDLPGVAPLWAAHYYRQWDYQPGTPPLIITHLEPVSRQVLKEDVRRLRPLVDVLVVSIHAGVHYVPALIADYQKEAAHLAVDCGADLVLQHHAHILKGIELYNGKAIFYGLGNFACDPIHPKRPAGDPFQKRQKELYRVKKVPGYDRYNGHPDGLKTMIVKAYIADRQIRKVTYIPAYINPNLEPEVVERDHPRAQEVFDYVRDISESEELTTQFSWDGNEVLISG